ncbi:hypothetical protein [Bacillus cereus]|uniref:hypothetical protein n=1 Tax=Bacillus cereus TaxID=1396 RepID=UPI000B4BCA94|nr:hypothetical protein [Bacillus cereus]
MFTDGHNRVEKEVMKGLRDRFPFLYQRGKLITDVFKLFCGEDYLEYIVQVLENADFTVEPENGDLIGCRGRRYHKLQSDLVTYEMMLTYNLKYGLRVSLDYSVRLKINDNDERIVFLLHKYAPEKTNNERQFLESMSLKEKERLLNWLLELEKAKKEEITKGLRIEEINNYLELGILNVVYDATAQMVKRVG